MTGTKRIRWEDADDGEATGRVGSLDRPVFRIWPPDEKGDCLLFAYLAGHQGDLWHGSSVDGQKAKAESLLAEFVSSLGAVFPEPGTVTVNEAALNALIDYADNARVGRDSQFCCSDAEYKASDEEFRALTAALSVASVPPAGEGE